jgi:DNA-directed RNA polymerase specialized sigma24 family protein
MPEPGQETPASRKVWQLDREGLDALLRALAPDREGAGRKYEELRRRLINLFAWEQCEAPEDLADEVLNRLARRVSEGTAIPQLDRFAFGIARLMLQEEGRRQKNRQALLRELRPTGQDSSPDWPGLEAMDRCLAALAPDRRQLIERYYVEDRASLARELGISLNALRNRAMRIREELFNCVISSRDDS